MLNYIKENFKDIMGYVIAGVIMTVIGYVITILAYDVFDFKAVYAFWIIIGPYSVLKYLIFKKVWKRKIKCEKCGFEGVG